MTLEGKAFAELRVSDVQDLFVTEPAKVQKSAKISEVIERMLACPACSTVYVIDVEGNLVGAVTQTKILELIGLRVGVRENSSVGFMHLLRDTLKENAEQIVAKTKTVKRDTKLSDALRIMVENRITELPIVDDDHKLIGELNGLELFAKGRDLFQK
ncbi:MAG TPA: CBS domain-containing protein [Methanomassiliicoccales archaeon]|nr:CBS domain-containing protein [Methanomassiliicoccales archaeon]